MTDPTPPTDQQLDEIEQRANAATPGPWRRPLNTRYKHTVTAPLPEGERGNWLDGIDPETGEREQCTVAMVPIWSNGKHSRQRGGRDLEYIAAMDPEVAKALVAEVRRLRAELAAATTPRTLRICACGHGHLAHATPAPHSCFAFGQTCKCEAYRQLPHDEAVAQLKRNQQAAAERVAVSAAGGAGEGAA